MAVEPIDITGGKSVYCFNRQQLEGAFALFREETPAGDRVRAAVEQLESTCSRNERAAVAFVLIDHLKTAE